MGHKISPIGLRIGINQYWRSRWFFSKNRQIFLEADYLIRKIINKMFPRAGLGEIIIERKSPDHCKLVIKTARPGFLIGRDGQILKNLIKKLEKEVNPLFEKNNLNPPKMDIDILEIKKPMLSAAYIAELAAIEIEKGYAVRSVLKKVLEKVKQQKGVLGIKIKASGRLDGSTIKRRETVQWGRVSLSKLVADIDYVQRPVLIKSGIVGLKVWLYKGDSSEFSLDVTA